MIRRFWTGLFVGLLLLEPTAGAQEGTWQQNFDAGKRLFQEGRYVEADKLMTAALTQAAGDRELYFTLNQLSLTLTQGQVGHRSSVGA